MVVTLGQLASVPGLPSEPTLRRMIEENQDFPLVSRGRNGVAYEMDLSDAIAFIKNLEAKKEEERRAKGEEVRQMGLALLGDDAASDLSQTGLSASERKALMEAEILATRLGRERGEFVRKVSVEAAMSEAFQMLNQKYRSLAARLSKRMELSREDIVTIDQMVERDLHELADKFEGMGSSGNADGGLTGDTAI